MKTEAVVIKNRNLSWLCREHYNGLQVVCIIRRAIRYCVPDLAIAAYIKKEFSNHLEQHFREEELWLFPKLPATDALRMRAEKQHAQLRNLVRSRQPKPETFANLLEEHIRFEERTLFPVFARLMND